MVLGTRGWDSGHKPHYTIKNSLMVYWSSCGSYQGEYLEELLVEDIFGLKERSDHAEVALPSLLIMTHIDSVTQSIQLVSSLLQSC